MTDLFTGPSAAQKPWIEQAVCDALLHQTAESNGTGTVEANNDGTNSSAFSSSSRLAHLRRINQDADSKPTLEMLRQRISRTSTAGSAAASASVVSLWQLSDASTSIVAAIIVRDEEEAETGMAASKAATTTAAAVSTNQHSEKSATTITRNVVEKLAKLGSSSSMVVRITSWRIVVYTSDVPTDDNATSSPSNDIGVYLEIRALTCLGEVLGQGIGGSIGIGPPQNRPKRAHYIAPRKTAAPSTTSYTTSTGTSFTGTCTSSTVWSPVLDTISVRRALRAYQTHVDKRRPRPVHATAGSAAATAATATAPIATVAALNATNQEDTTTVARTTTAAAAAVSTSSTPIRGPPMQPSPALPRVSFTPLGSVANLFAMASNNGSGSDELDRVMKAAMQVAAGAATTVSSTTTSRDQNGGTATAAASSTGAAIAAPTTHTTATPHRSNNSSSLNQIATNAAAVAVASASAQKAKRKGFEVHAVDVPPSPARVRQAPAKEVAANSSSAKRRRTSVSTENRKDAVVPLGSVEALWSNTNGVSNQNGIVLDRDQVFAAALQADARQRMLANAAVNVAASTIRTTTSTQSSSLQRAAIVHHTTGNQQHEDTLWDDSSDDEDGKGTAQSQEHLGIGDMLMDDDDETTPPPPRRSSSTAQWTSPKRVTQATVASTATTPLVRNTTADDQQGRRIGSSSKRRDNDVATHQTNTRTPSEDVLDRDQLACTDTSNGKSSRVAAAATAAATNRSDHVAETSFSRRQKKKAKPVLGGDFIRSWFCSD